MNSTATFRSIIQLRNDIELNPGPQPNGVCPNSRKTQRIPRNVKKPCGNTSAPSVKLFFQNSRSLKTFYYDNDVNCYRNKLSCLQDVAYTNNLDILAIVETWLTNNISDHEILPVGYKIIRRDRPSGKRGGGVLLAVKDNIQTESFPFTSGSLELVATVILSPNKNILIAVCYRPPDSTKDFVSELERFLTMACESRFQDVVLLGDFNFPNIVWNNGSGFSNFGREHSFTELMVDYNYFQLVEMPTRGNNILDLLFTTNDNLIDNVELSDDECCSLNSDHKAVICDIVLRCKPKPPVKRIVYDYSRVDIGGLLNALGDAELLDIVQRVSHDVNIAWSEWKEAFVNVFEKYIPRTTTKRRSSTPLYMTKELPHAIKRKESLRKKAKKKDTLGIWERFRKERQRIKCCH